MDQHRTSLWMAGPLFAAWIACAGSQSTPAPATPPEGQTSSPEVQPTQTLEPAQDTAPDPDVVGEDVTYSAGEVTMRGYIAYDKARTGPRPGVLIVHEWWGQNEYARERARKLAELGYTALALDMYGEGKTASHPDDAGKFAGQVRAHMDEAEQRFAAAQKVLQEHATTDPEQIAAIGYCFGGGVVLHMALVGMDLDVVASFHGSLGAVLGLTPHDVKAKVMVFHGADDPFVEPDQVKAFKEKTRAAGVDLTFEAYPGAVHAFTNPAADENGGKFGLPLKYDAAADVDSWQKLQQGLERAFEL